VTGYETPFRDTDWVQESEVGFKYEEPHMTPEDEHDPDPTATEQGSEE
jgi:hypothetical protein